VQALERLVRLAVVMLPPCPSPPLVATAMHTFRLFEVFLGCFVSSDYYKRDATKHRLMSIHARRLQNRS
jgi:hypothetical protein